MYITGEKSGGDAFKKVKSEDQENPSGRLAERSVNFSATANYRSVGALGASLFVGNRRVFLLGNKFHA